jgi:hypothetical protein
MAVGYALQRAEIDARAGEITRHFQKAFDDVAVMQGFLTRTVDADLIALGYTANDVALLKTAFADLTQLGRIFLGAEPLPAVKDFRTFVGQLWGVGAF